MLAEIAFGVQTHWRKRIVRSGINTLCIAADDPPVLEIASDDTVFIDLGPVVDEWEADGGRHRLCADPYAHAQRAAEAAGWRLGGAIAGIWSASSRLPAWGISLATYHRSTRQRQESQRPLP